MVTVTFPNEKIRLQAIGFVVKRFPGKMLRSGEHFIPEEALIALVRHNIPFTFKGQITEDDATAAVRDAVRRAAARKVKRKKPVGS
jgi:hypothetical protein